MRGGCHWRSLHVSISTINVLSLFLPKEWLIMLLKKRNFSGIHGVALLSTVSRSNWNLEMLVFVEGGKPEYPEKNRRSRDENQQQTQPTNDAETGNRTRATLVGGESVLSPLRHRCSHGADQH